MVTCEQCMEYCDQEGAVPECFKDEPKEVCAYMRAPVLLPENIDTVRTWVTLNNFGRHYSFGAAYIHLDTVMNYCDRYGFNNGVIQGVFIIEAEYQKKQAAESNKKKTKGSGNGNSNKRKNR